MRGRCPQCAEETTIPVLGIDIGTSGSRAVLLDDGGRLVASATADHAPFRSPRTGWAEQDPDDWWRACQEAVRAVLRQGSAAGRVQPSGCPGRCTARCCSTSAVTSFGPSIIWCDQRTEDECRWLNDTVGATRLLELTSNPALTNFTLTKLLWVRAHEPRLWARVRHVLLPKDYVRFRLSGEYATDVADASGTLMLDVARRRWSRDDARRRRTSTHVCCPRVFESPEVCARVSRGAAALPACRQARRSSPAPAIRRPAPSAWASHGPARSARRSGRPASSSPRPIGPRSIRRGGCTRSVMRSPDAGTSWASRRPPVCRCDGFAISWPTWSGPSSYDDLTAEAAQRPARRGRRAVGAVSDGRADAALRSERSRRARRPCRQSRARAIWCARSWKAWRSACATRSPIFAELRVPVERVRLGGGGARSPLWRQIQADVYGRSVDTVAADEGAAYGAAILAGVGVGRLADVDAACEALVRRATRHTPSPTVAAHDERAVRRVPPLYPALRLSSVMADPFAPRPEAQVLLRPVDRRQSRPRPVRRRRARSAAAGRRRRDARGGRRVGRQPARQRPGADRRDARRTRSHRQGVQGRAASGTASSCRWRP